MSPASTEREHAIASRSDGAATALARGAERTIDSFLRVSRFRERGALAMITAAFVASLGVHASVAQTAHVTSIWITPASPTCRVGEMIQVEAFATMRAKMHPKVTASTAWTSSQEAVARVEGEGWVRCTQEGSSTIHASFDGSTADVTINVLPLIQLIDIKDEPPPPEPEPEEKVDVKLAPKPEEKAAPQKAAKAGQLLTAPTDKASQADDDTPTFPTDENGNEYGFGKVARGGTEESATGKTSPSASTGGAGGSGERKGPPPPVQQAPSVDLSRPADLLVPDPCRGYYPADADDDSAVVKVVVVVKPSGEVASVSIVDENPRGQGFGKAARACLSSKRFQAALGRDGAAVQASVAKTIRFTR